MFVCMLLKMCLKLSRNRVWCVVCEFLLCVCACVLFTMLVWCVCDLPYFCCTVCLFVRVRVGVVLCLCLCVFLFMNVFVRCCDLLCDVARFVLCVRVCFSCA